MQYTSNTCANRPIVEFFLSSQRSPELHMSSVTSAADLLKMIALRWKSIVELQLTLAKECSSDDLSICFSLGRRVFMLQQVSLYNISETKAGSVNALSTFLFYFASTH